LADKGDFSDSTRFERNRLFVNAILDQASLFDRRAKPRLSEEDSKPWSADHGPYWNKDLLSVLVATEYSEELISITAFIRPNEPCEWPSLRQFF
jgi:hypothetical protein